MKITCSLGTIDKAIRELEAYKKEIERKCALLGQRIAELIRQEAQAGFDSAVVDDLTERSGGARMAQVEVSVDDKGDVLVVIASGEDAVFAEFGAGIRHNAPAGASPHPKGAEFGFTIGGYGLGYGNRETWGFYENGELRLTHGAPASMPLFRAALKAREEMTQIAREVFG